MRRPQPAQKFSVRRAARCRPGSVSSTPKARAPRTAASSGSITARRLNVRQRRVGAVLRFGLVGTGYWADVAHAAGIVAHPQAELVGVWGRDPAKAAALAAKHGVRAFDELDELSAAVDAVAFSVPPDVQAELALPAAEAGKALLLEKPLALSVEPAERLVDAVRAPTVVFFTYRLHPRVAPRDPGDVDGPGWGGAGGVLPAPLLQARHPL